MKKVKAAVVQGKAADEIAKDDKNEPVNERADNSENAVVDIDADGKKSIGTYSKTKQYYRRKLDKQIKCFEGDNKTRYQTVKRARLY